MADTKIPYDIIVQSSNFTSSAKNIVATICLFGEKRSTAMLTLGSKAFDTTHKQQFQVDALDVGKLKKIKIQLVSDGPASWGLEWIVVKFKTEYVMFRAMQILDQQRDPKGEGSNNSTSYYSTIQVFAEKKEVHHIPYQVTIKTKNYEGFSAETSSEVHIAIFGDKGNTGKLKFEFKGINRKKMFDKNNSHTFDFYAIDVGALTNIRITHSNKEETAQWYLEYVTVKACHYNAKEYKANLAANQASDHKAIDYKIKFDANQWLRKSPYNDQLRIDLFAPRKADEENHKEQYQVKIKTGDVPDAGTDKDVTIQLHGKYGSTKQITLDRKKTKKAQIFGKGMENTFIFTEKDVGPIQRINVGHHEFGTGARWYVERISVSCPCQTLVFSAGQWLNSDTAIDFFPKVADNKENLETYHVITKTGTLPEASTDANVYVILNGDNGETEKVELDVNCDYDLFEHDQEDIITVKAPNVGNIHSIKVGHDNEGRSPNWYLNGIDIIHPAYNESVDITGNCWLGDNTTRRDGGDQTVETELFHVAESHGEGDEISYSIEIKTGKYTGSKNAANVKICIIGERDSHAYNTGMIELKHPTGKDDEIFDKSARHLYLVKGVDVGSLYKIKIIHDNPDGKAAWYLDYVAIKTHMYYKRIKVEKWLLNHESTGQLYLDIVPPNEEQKKVKYNVILKTGNFRGFDPDTEADPVWICVYGDKGNTGMVNWKMPANDKAELFDRNNKHYLTLNADDDVGKISCIRVVHTNYAGNAEWQIDWISVKTENQLVRFKSKEWLQKTNCDNRLQLDIYAPGPTAPEPVKYIVKVKTGDHLQADTFAKVHINFHGTHGETGQIALDSPTLGRSLLQVPFRRGQEDEFVVLGKDVGRIFKINIGHDNSGKVARWFVVSVTVDVPTQEQSLLFAPNKGAGRWLDSAESASPGTKVQCDLHPKSSDNPDHKTTYHITTKTGDIPGASTDANVFIILYGADGKTDKIQLDLYSNRGDLFEQDNEDLFSVVTADIGPVKKITIGHDDQGVSPDWYVKWISVVCPSHSFSGIFYADRWVSTTQGKKAIEHDIIPASHKDDTIIYDVTFMTANYRGYGETYGNISVVIFGDQYNTGPMVVDVSALDKDRPFDKSNKHTYKLRGIAVGTVRKIKVMLDNLAGKSEWKLSWVKVKTDGEEEVKIPIEDWLPKSGPLAAEYLSQ